MRWAPLPSPCTEGSISHFLELTGRSTHAVWCSTSTFSRLYTLERQRRRGKNHAMTILANLSRRKRDGSPPSCASGPLRADYAFLWLYFDIRCSAELKRPPFELQSSRRFAFQGGGIRAFPDAPPILSQTFVRVTHTFHVTAHALRGLGALLATPYIILLYRISIPYTISTSPIEQSSTCSCFNNQLRLNPPPTSPFRR